MKKSELIKKYMSYEYAVEVKKIADEDGGGYMACIPQLGRYAFVGDGETEQEAIDMLKEVKKDHFELYIKKGIEVPQPVQEEDVAYSGKFLLRIPTEMHALLATNAKKNNTTLNQYCVYILTKLACKDEKQAELKQVLESIECLKSQIGDFDYQLHNLVKTKYNYNVFGKEDQYPLSS